MKKQSFILLSVLLCACTMQLDETTTSNLVTERLQNDTNLKVLMKHSHKFTFDSAALLVSNLHSIPSLKKMANSFASGGTFPARLFHISPDSSGIIFWFGFNPVENELFLAMEHLKSYNIFNLPKGPTSANLIRPAFTFKNTRDDQLSRAAAQDYLKNEVIAKNGGMSIERTTLLGHMNSFDSLLRSMPDGNGEKYNLFPFSYFHDNKDGLFEKFVAQAGDNGYVRYYFGLDETERPNRIRVILMAVDSSGNNITSINTEGDALLLQKSFPPPPDSY